MPKISFAHLCDYALISNDGKLSVMGIYSAINVRSVPAMHPLTFVAYELSARNVDLGRTFTLRMEVVDIDGAAILRMEKKGQFQGQVKTGETARLSEVVRLPPIPFKRAGRHAINLFINDEPSFELGFDVVIVSPPAAPQGPPNA